MATKSENKTEFVKEYLSDHPEGNVNAVNAAWTAAGMKGTIGSTLIYKMRSQMGLSGMLRAKAKPRMAAKAKSATHTSKTASTQGKTMFVKEFLIDDPQATVDSVTKAWQSAGFDGTISPALVNKLRASLGLTGNLRANTTKANTSTPGKNRGMPRKETSAAVNERAVGQSRGGKSDRMHALLSVEAEIDKLMFQVMAIGDLPEVETTLRDARRLVYRALSF